MAEREKKKSMSKEVGCCALGLLLRSSDAAREGSAGCPARWSLFRGLPQGLLGMRT
jgi:hypothetical protein